MYLNAPETEPAATATVTVLELLVKNHPGVMTHVCSLFSRRAYNLEGIAVLPVGDGIMSRIWLKVVEETRLDQIVKQVEKLHDVKSVVRHGHSHPVFTGMAEHFQP
ncbi:ACT domain-containing protein [Desulfofustis limnaeus]|jgi:acetolactate synthase-1/3 small subunit|uniref:acetolactate synthase n=1 Tax=Desulfofustis limnaeus TaxID=2740163 RepID=A0ABM7W9A0_9BACT|nr:ACT domain-containing protein [Desulfofustis limnaeus]MDX9893975.1 ACT domain-containing protein [Desulfofustis sp.]BDD87503.1 acetolactate synthase isozyme 1 small subunit [Desulfofustis limnaeus]